MKKMKLREVKQIMYVKMALRDELGSDPEEFISQPALLPIMYIVPDHACSTFIKQMFYWEPTAQISALSEISWRDKTCA